MRYVIIYHLFMQFHVLQQVCLKTLCINEKHAKYENEVR